MEAFEPLYTLEFRFQALELSLCSISINGLVQLYLAIYVPPQTTSGPPFATERSGSKTITK